MEQKEIEEGNKLIAEFMGGKIKNKLVTFNGGWDDSDLSFISGLKYHTSWDWLMPVVEKIEKSKTPTWVKIYGDDHIYSCEIYDEDSDYAIADIRDNTSKIDVVFRAVVKFTKWHNANPNNK